MNEIERAAQEAVKRFIPPKSRGNWIEAVRFVRAQTGADLRRSMEAIKAVLGARK